jgi:poly(3-hydroxybutyrate) depolymerase
MKMLFLRTLSLVFLLCLTSCAETKPEYIEGMINPGDEIDGMLFTTVDEIDWDYSLGILCDRGSAEVSEMSSTMDCFTSPGGIVFFGNCNGILHGDPNKAGDAWEDFNLRVTFDDQELNLPLFGYIDDDTGGSGEEKYLRVWNLLVENITAGSHTIQCIQGNEGETDTRTYHLQVSAQPEIYPSLEIDAPHHINPYTSEKANINYLLYLPSEYGENPEREWPLLIYLHGMTRVNTSVNLLRNDYPLKTLAEQDYFPFIVLAPLGRGGYEFWAKDEMTDSVLTLIDEVEYVLSVDADRIYLTGESAGGNGAWEIGVRHPDLFAALVSISGYYGWPVSVPDNICDLKKVPVWAFHGAEDELIPLDAEQMLVDALKACGGDVRFTVFPDIGHDLRTEQVYTSELYAWLLEQSRK